MEKKFVELTQVDSIGDLELHAYMLGAEDHKEILRHLRSIPYMYLAHVDADSIMAHLRDDYSEVMKVYDMLEEAGWGW